MCNANANYMLTHLIRKNKSVRPLKSVLWCGGWLGECGALVCLSSEGLPVRSHSSLQTPCIIKQSTSLLGGIVCVLFETSETSATPNHILLSSAASNRFRLRLSGTAEFSVGFCGLFVRLWFSFVCNPEFLSSTFFTLLLQLRSRHFQRFLLLTGNKEKKEIHLNLSKSSQINRHLVSGWLIPISFILIFIVIC